MELTGFLCREPAAWESVSLVVSEGRSAVKRSPQVLALRLRGRGGTGSPSPLAWPLGMGEGWRSAKDGRMSTPELRRDLVFAVEVDLGAESESFEEEDRKEAKEREEGMMEAREDLLEVMLGNMTTGSGQSRSKSRPQRKANGSAVQQCNMQRWESGQRTTRRRRTAPSSR